MNANHVLCNNLGYSSEEFQQLKLWDFIEELTWERLEALIAPLRSGVLDVQVISAVHRRKNGTTYPVAIRLQLMATQYPPVFTAFILDMTSR